MIVPIYMDSCRPAKKKLTLDFSNSNEPANSDLPNKNIDDIDKLNTFLKNKSSPDENLHKKDLNKIENCSNEINSSSRIIKAENFLLNHGKKVAEILKNGNNFK